MKTNFISPDGVQILKTQQPIDCPYTEDPEAFSWCKCVGLFVDPKTLEPRSTGRNGGFFGVSNGREYSFPVEFTLPTRAEAEAKLQYSVESVLAVPEKYGGGFVIVRPGLASSIKKMLLEG